MLKGGLRGGLTGMARSCGGSEVDMEPFLDMARNQMAMEDGGDEYSSSAEGTLKERLQRSGLSLEAYLRGCNAHLVDNPEPATHLPYFDINSLYPAAGKRFTLLPEAFLFLSRVFFFCSLVKITHA
jgi:hypothetical protein